MHASLLFLSGCVLAGALFSAVARAGNREAESFSRTLGDLELTVLSVDWRDQQVSMLIPKTSEEKAAIARSYPDGTARNSQNVLLIRGKGVVALVDTGFDRTVPRLCEALERAGVRPEDVTHVILTHAHGDHTGGLLREGRPTFPHARVLLSEAESAYWLNPEHAASAPPRFKGIFTQLPALLQPYGNRVGTFAPGATLLPGLPAVQAVAEYGHTPGHVGIMISADGHTVLFWADLLHAADVQIPYPEISATFDFDPAAAAAVRKTLLDRAREAGWLVCGTHVPFVEPVTLKP